MWLIISLMHLIDWLVGWSAYRSVTVAPGIFIFFFLFSKSGIDVVYPISLSPEILRVSPSSEDLWGSTDQGKGLYVLLNIVLGGFVPRNWEQMFKSVPQICWVPIIAVRYMLDRCPGLFVPDDFLDVLLATVTSVVHSRQMNPHRTILSDYDRTANDVSVISCFSTFSNINLSHFFIIFKPIRCILSILHFQT